MMVQLFGWTEPTTPINGYVKFLSVSDAGGGQVSFVVRNEGGGINEILLPPEAVRELAGVLGSRET